MAGKVKPAVPILVPYPPKEKVRLAGALALRELGLVEKLREVMAKQEEDEKNAQAPASSLAQLTESPDVREDAVLEEIFNTPDVISSSESKEEINFDEFRHSALLLVGLAGMVEKISSDQKRLKVLEAGQVEPQPLFLVLSFFHQWLSAGGLEETLEPWLEEVLSAVPQLLNLKLDHPFLKDSRHLCTEFLDDSLLLSLLLKRNIYILPSPPFLLSCARAALLANTQPIENIFLQEICIVYLCLFLSFPSASTPSCFAERVISENLITLL